MPEFIVRHRLPVLVAAVLVIAAGIASWNRLAIDAFPDTTNQQVMILAEAPGLGPLDVEQQVTFPIETLMGGLPHVTLVRSLSKTALSQVVVVFEDHVDTYFARQLVFERLQSARDRLPSGVEPSMGPISTGLGEVLQYTLRSDRMDLTELRTLHDWLVAPRLRTVPGVNEVNSFGGRVRQVEVRVDPDSLVKYGLSLADLAEALEANNANAGGSFIVRAWEQENIRNLGLFGSLEDIRQTGLLAGDGSFVTVADLADVVESHMTRLGVATRDGEGEAMVGMVIMLKDENSKDVVERVKAAIPSIEQALPEGVTIDVFYDRTELVTAVVGTVGRALLQGGLLVLLVLFGLIGNLRAALTAAFALPMTALMTFVFMDAAGLGANLMTLGGLAIAIGMVVDGSIVVTENVTRHLRAEPGGGAAAAVARGLREVARPIVFSILIIMVVFVPLFALEGMEGRMFEPLALTMIFAMLGSLLAAMTIVPVLLSYLMKGASPDRERRLVTALRLGYRRLLDRAITHRRITLGIAAALFLASLAAIPRLGVEFLPDLDEGAIAINVVRHPNASLEGSTTTADFIERELLAFPEVRTVVSKTGRAEISEDPMGPEQTDVMIMLHPESEWHGGRDKSQLVGAIDERLSRIPGIRLAFSQPIALRINELVSGVKSDLAVKIFGEDIAILKDQADRVAAILRRIPGSGDVNVEQVAGFGELEIVPDRRELARHGLSMGDLNELVEVAVGGKIVTELVEGQMRFGVNLRYPESSRNSAEAVAALLLVTADGARVPVGSVASVRQREGPARISRENSMRRVVVEVNVRDRDLGSFVAEVEERLRGLTDALPPGYWFQFGGTFENQQRAMQRLSLVVPVSVLLIFLMLLTALGSGKAALLVLINLPFALVGGLGAMLLFDITLSVPAVVGFIALFGVAVQNGTVLVTFVAQLRRQGLPVREAVLEAGSLRLRALLMTAATTVLGLLPLVLATGPGSEIQRPLAVVVIGGLLSATALTLFVLPTLYVRLAPDPPEAGPPEAAVSRK